VWWASPLRPGARRGRRHGARVWGRGRDVKRAEGLKARAAAVSLPPPHSHVSSSARPWTAFLPRLKVRPDQTNPAPARCSPALAIGRGGGRVGREQARWRRRGERAMRKKKTRRDVFCFWRGRGPARAPLPAPTHPTCMQPWSPDRAVRSGGWREGGKCAARSGERKALHERPGPSGPGARAKFRVQEAGPRLSAPSARSTCPQDACSYGWGAETRERRRGRARRRPGAEGERKRKTRASRSCAP